MGALHEGHLSLIKQSLKTCNQTVVSIFVNKKQFSPNEDFKKYPRSLDGDVSALEALNVDVLFVPDRGEIYPKNYSTYIEENFLSLGLEGSSRPLFFRGVLTVVLKLFNIINPDIAWFGKKDFQQLRLVQKMIKDLDLNIKIFSGETIREKSGLAMSSRNQYLNSKMKKKLGEIYFSLVAAKESIKRGEREVSDIKKNIKNHLLKNIPSIEIDYIEVSDAKTLKNIKIINKNAIISLAVIVGGVRLIDNIEVSI